MSTEINKAFVQQYSSNLIMLAEQKGSKLSGTVTKKGVVGKAAHFDRLGSTTASLRTSRHSDTPQVDTPHSRRKVTLNDYHTADLIDEQDEVRMLIDPKGPYAVKQANALGRVLDDLICDAFTGNATSVDSADGTSNVAIAFTVDQSFNTSNSDIIIEKVVEAKRIMMTNEVDSSEEAYFVLDSISLHNLIKESEVASIDYNTVRALASGAPGTVMGFNFIQCERVNTSSEGFKQCMAYTRSALGLAMGKEINTTISTRADKCNATQVYSTLTAGAVRVQEENAIVVEAYRA